MRYIYAAVISFLMGSIPFAYLVGRAYGKTDIRNVGSKNAGAGNVFHLYGIKAGLLALAGDLMKGFFAVYLSEYLFGFEPFELVILGFFSVLGHVYSPFLRFRGGKGAAATVGVFLFVICNALNIKAIYLLAILIGIWLLLLLVTHSQVVSLAVIFPIFPLLLFSFTKDLKLFIVTAFFVVMLEYFGRGSFKRELKASYEKYLKRFFRR